MHLYAKHCRRARGRHLNQPAFRHQSYISSRSYATFQARESCCGRSDSRYLLPRLIPPSSPSSSLTVWSRSDVSSPPTFNPTRPQKCLPSSTPPRLRWVSLPSTAAPARAPSRLGNAPSAASRGPENGRAGGGAVVLNGVLTLVLFFNFFDDFRARTIIIPSLFDARLLPLARIRTRTLCRTNEFLD